MKKIGINLIPFLLTIFIIYLSYNSELWLNFWATLSISPVIPPFSDLDSILKTLLSRNFGFNVYLENPHDPTHGVYLYPSIWLDIFEFLKLSTQIYFKAFNFIIIFIYFFIIQDLYIKNYFLKVFFFIFALAGKVFPIFSIFLFIKNKKEFLLILVLSFSYLLFIREEIYFMSVNIIEYARIFAYGSGSVAKAMYYFSKEYNLFINDENYIYLKLSIIFLFATIAIILIKINFIFGKKQLHKDMNLEDRLFLAGGGIYLGTFIFSANVDYRLVFLLLTFTYILNINNLLIKYIYIFSCTMIFNSFFF